MNINRPVQLGLATLCLLAGSGWILSEWQPEALPGLWPIALRSGILAIAFWTLARARTSSRRQSVPASAWAPIFGWSVLMAGVPAAMAVSAAGQVSQSTEAVLFSLIPVFVIFFISQTATSFGVQESPLRLLAPALLGVAGAALLIPIHIPDTRGGQAWLILLLASAVASGLAAIRLHTRLAGMPTLPAAALFSAAIFLIAALLGFFQAGQISSWSASAVRIEVFRSLLFDGPVTLLTVWLLRAVPPVAFSSRYLLILAVTVIEGYLLLAPQTTWTTGAGMLLLLVSGAWLLLADAPNVP